MSLRGSRGPDCLVRRRYNQDYNSLLRTSANSHARIGLEDREPARWALALGRGDLGGRGVGLESSVGLDAVAAVGVIRRDHVSRDGLGVDVGGDAGRLGDGLGLERDHGLVDLSIGDDAAGRQTRERRLRRELVLGEDLGADVRLLLAGEWTGDGEEVVLIDRRGIEDRRENLPIVAHRVVEVGRDGVGIEAVDADGGLLDVGVDQDDALDAVIEVEHLDLLRGAVAGEHADGVGDDAPQLHLGGQPGVALVGEVLQHAVVLGEHLGQDLGGDRVLDGLDVAALELRAVDLHRPQEDRVTGLHGGEQRLEREVEGVDHHGRQEGDHLLVHVHLLSMCAPSKGTHHGVKENF